MADTAPASTRPNVNNIGVHDVHPDHVTVRLGDRTAWVAIGPLSIWGATNLHSSIDEQLTALRDIGWEIVAQATAAIEQRARIQAVTS